MTDRRKFIKLTALGAGAVALNACAPEPETPEESVAATAPEELDTEPSYEGPIVVSTWNHGLAANDEAWKIIDSGGRALDAVEAGVRVTESDPDNRSVGLGGLPDRDGNVTLDACIQDETSNCGAVAFLQHIENPISVARKVMEDTPHVMMVGQGALDFALEKGFEKTELLTDGARADWEKWLETQEMEHINSENHDTIGMVALDEDGNLSGACTTSGWAYKLHGRVGDSPIIGAGLFVDNEVGAACATGAGEAVIRTAGSHTVVELMRQGYHPGQACKMAVARIIDKHQDLTNLQVGFLAIDKYGRHGGYSVYAGFNYALRTADQNELIDAGYELEW